VGREVRDVAGGMVVVINYNLQPRCGGTGDLLWSE
jgi:hypothetical protein